MVRAIIIEGFVIGLFIILDGIYVILFPPFSDEPQGYAIAAIGIFIILITMYISRVMEKYEDGVRVFPDDSY